MKLTLDTFHKLVSVITLTFGNDMVSNIFK